ncbi:hypothetical protein BET10_12520 [Pseudoalteromonas amylolytica]|uniref:Uncharacterized protein n=1 Tax=Pseudoalteromonas amylolytica TaxID=1859457 RepID=A0A1S1MVL7_9GAMM|nr:hypothetical protein BFC16_12400 [Pseudoalteromonas sp. JW3]OHU91622.1 hypothetical protein BET10_12520 [Pseudoalteromonas amylolytica]
MNIGLSVYKYVYYCFYCFFRSTQWVTFGWSEKSQYARASWLLGMCETWLIGGVVALISSIFHFDLRIGNPLLVALVPTIVLVAIHFHCFHKDGNAKKIVESYDQLSTKGNRVGKLAVFIVILLSGWFVVESFSLYGESVKR